MCRRGEHWREGERAGWEEGGIKVGGRKGGEIGKGECRGDGGGKAVTPSLLYSNFPLHILPSLPLVTE